MAKFVFTPLGSLGDLHPMMGVAQCLQEQGHEAVLATGAYYREYIESAGLSFTPVPPNLDPTSPEIIRKILDVRNGPKALYQELVFPSLEQGVKDLTQAVKGADLIVSSVLSYFAPMTSELTGVPWASALLSPMLMWSPYDPPVFGQVPWLGRARFLGPTVHRAALSCMLAVAEPWAKPVQELRKKLGLKKLKNAISTGVQSPLLNLCLWSKYFGPPQPDWQASSVTTGFVYYDPSSQKELNSVVRAFLEKQPRPVIFTLGSTSVHDADALLETFFQTAQHIDAPVIITVGQKKLPLLSSRSHERLLVTDYVPYGKVFPSASVIVHQGGVGTTGQALLAGRPQLVLPVATDQYDNGERVKRLGAGEVLPLKKVTVKRLAEKVRNLLNNPSLKKTAQTLGQSIAQESGAETAAKILIQTVKG